MKKAASNRGFSLVELMCAILIMGFGLVALTQGLTTALSSSKESELQTNAALIAAGRIETLRAEGYIVDGETDGDCGDALPLYQWKQTINKTAIDGLHQVSIVVENAKSGQTIYELQTLLFDVPLTTTEDSRKKSDPTQRKKRGRPSE
jgi:prepilin-type N-terminal cleavage/methylation domain-containing protein